MYAFLQVFFLLLCGIIILPSSVEADSPAILSSYHVSTNVTSRVATTSIDMVFENPNEDCSDTRSLTLQLPRNARLTNLFMDLSDGCELDSTVKSLDEAVQDFETMASEGKAAALVTASWDMTNYDLQVSIPPNGTTNVLLQYEELLYQKLDKVDFQVPLFPSSYVKELLMDIHVEDRYSGILDLSLLFFHSFFSSKVNTRNPSECNLSFQVYLNSVLMA